MNFRMNVLYGMFAFAWCAFAIPVAEEDDPDSVVSVLSLAQLHEHETDASKVTAEAAAMSKAMSKAVCLEERKKCIVKPEYAEDWEYGPKFTKECDMVNTGEIPGMKPWKKQDYLKGSASLTGRDFQFAVCYNGLDDKDFGKLDIANKCLWTCEDTCGKPKNAQGRWKHVGSYNYGTTREFATGWSEDTTHERTKEWSAEVSVTVSGGFMFGDVEVSSSYAQGASDTISDSFGKSGEEVTTIELPNGGTVWQFEYTSKDDCGQATGVLTKDLVVTPGRDLPPCCLPGYPKFRQVEDEFVPSRFGGGAVRPGDGAVYYDRVKSGEGPDAPCAGGSPNLCGPISTMPPTPRATSPPTAKPTPPPKAPRTKPPTKPPTKPATKPPKKKKSCFATAEWKKDHPGNGDGLCPYLKGKKCKDNELCEWRK